jgi:hypothetical protein
MLLEHAAATHHVAPAGPARAVETAPSDGLLRKYPYALSGHARIPDEKGGRCKRCNTATGKEMQPRKCSASYLEPPPSAASFSELIAPPRL